MEWFDSPIRGNTCYKSRNGSKIRIFSSVFVLIYVILSTREVYAKIRVMELVQKSGLWTHGFYPPRNDGDTGLNCAGSWVQHSVNNENSIFVVVDIQTYMGGYFEFRLCPNKNPQSSVTQECLTSNRLRIWDVSNNDSSYRYFPEEMGSQRLRIEIPTGIDCIHCVVHWKWIMADRVKRCRDSTSQIGCRSKKEIFSCADLSVKAITIESRKPETGVVESMFIGEQQTEPTKLNIIPVNASVGNGHTSTGSNEPKLWNGQPNLLLDGNFASDAIPLSIATAFREWTEDHTGRATKAESTPSEAVALFIKQSETRRSKKISPKEMEPIKVIQNSRSSRIPMLNIIVLSRRRRQANLPPPPPILSSSTHLILEQTQNPSAGTSGLIGDQFGRISSRAQKQFITQQDFVQGLPGTSDILTGEALGEFGMPSTGTDSRGVLTGGEISSSLAVQSVNLHTYSHEPIVAAPESNQGNLNDVMPIEALGMPAGGASIDTANVHPSSMNKQKIPKPPKQSTAELKAAIADAPSISSAVLGTKIGTGPADLVGASYISELNEGRSNQAETSTAAKHGSTIVDIIDQERFGPTGTKVEYLARSSGTSIGETSADTQAEIRSATMNFARYSHQPTAEQILTGNTGFRHSTDNMDTTNQEPVGSSADSAANAVPGILSTILGGQTKVTDASLDPAVKQTREELIRQLGEAMGVIGNGKALPSQITKSNETSTAGSLNSVKQAVQASKSIQNEAAKKVIDGVSISIGNKGSAKAIIDEKRSNAQGSTNKTRKLSQNNGDNWQRKLQDFQGMLETVGTSSQQATNNTSTQNGQPLDLIDLGMPGITLEEMMMVLNMEQFSAGENTSQTFGSISSTPNIKRMQAVAQMNDLSNTKSASVGVIQTAELSTFDKSASQKLFRNIAGIKNDLNSSADIEANMFETVVSPINAADQEPSNRKVGMANTGIHANMHSTGHLNNANVTGFQMYESTGVDSAGISQSQSQQADNTQTLSNMLMDMLTGGNTENTALSNLQAFLSVGTPSSNGQVENRANQALAKMNRQDGNSLILNSNTTSSMTIDKKSPMNANIQSMQEISPILSLPAIVSTTRSATDKNIKSFESASKQTVSPRKHLSSPQPEAMLTDTTNIQQSLNTGVMSQADIDSMMSMFSSGQMNLNDLEQYLNPAIFDTARQKPNSNSIHSVVNVSSSTSVLPTESMTSNNVKSLPTNINSVVSRSSSAAANTPTTYMTEKSELVTASTLGSFSPIPISNTDPEVITNLINPAGTALDNAGTISLADLLAGRYTGGTFQQNLTMSSNNLSAENTEGMFANVLGSQTGNTHTALSNAQLRQVDQGTDFTRVSSHFATSSTAQNNWNLNPRQLAASDELHGQIIPINKSQMIAVSTQSPQHISAVSSNAHTPMDHTVFGPLSTIDPLVFKTKTTTKSLEINPALEKISHSIQQDMTSTFGSNASNVDRNIFEKNASILSRNLVDRQLMNGQLLSLPSKNISADISIMPIMLQQSNVHKTPNIMTDEASQSTSVVNPRPTGLTLFYDTRPKDTTPTIPAVFQRIDNTSAVGRANLQEQHLLEQEKQTRIEMKRLVDKHREEIGLMEQQKKEHLRQLNEAKQQIEYEKQQLILQKQQLELEALRKEQLQQRQILDEQRKQMEQEKLLLKQERILATQAAKFKAAEEERRRTTELETERQRLIAAETERIKQEQARIHATEEVERRRVAEAEQARLIAEQSSKARAEQETILRQEHLANIRIEEEARLKAKEQVRLKAEEESRMRAEEQTRQEAASAAAAAVIAAVNSKKSVDTHNKINVIGQNQTDSSFTPTGAIGGTESQNGDISTAAAWQAYVMASQGQSQTGLSTGNKGAGTQSSALQTILQNNALAHIQKLNPAWRSVLPGVVPQQSAVQSDLAPHAIPSGLATLGLDTSLLMQLLQQQQQKQTTTSAPIGTTPKPQPLTRNVPVRPDPQTREHVLNMFLNNMGPGVDPLSILIGLTPEMLMKSGVNPLIANSGDLSKIVPAVERALGISLNAIPAGPGQMPSAAGSLTPLVMGDSGIGGGVPHDRVQALRQQMLQQRMMTEMMQLMGIGPDPLEPGDPGYRGTGASTGRSAIALGMGGPMIGGGLGGGVGGPSGAGTNQFDMMGAI